MTQKNIFALISSVILLLNFSTGCDTFTYYSSSERKLELENEADSVLVFGCNGGEKHVSLLASSSWTARSNKNWCEVSPESGKGDSTLVISISANPDTEDRIAAVTVTMGLSTLKITVEQNQKNAIVAAGNQYEVESDEGILEFTVTSNVEFEVECDADWLIFEPTKGMTDTELTFRYLANPEPVRRNCTITLTAEGTTQEIEVIQKEGAYTYAVTILHSNPNFTIPYIGLDEYDNLTGTIWWGDGSSDEWEYESVHQYDGQGTWQMRMEVNAPKTEDAYITAPDIVGVVEIDLSEF